MNIPLLPSLCGLIHPLFVGGLLISAWGASAASAEPAFDDFSVDAVQPCGLPRMVITDEPAGGQSQAEMSVADGVLRVSGALKPGRGMPGFVSLPLVLNPDGSARDVSSFTGVRLVVKVEKGSLTVQVSSSEVTNFDYHTSPPIARNSDGLQEVRIPFSSLRQVWSAPTELNLATITSINLVAAGVAPAAFAYAVDEIGFY